MRDPTKSILHTELSVYPAFVCSFSYEVVRQTSEMRQQMNEFLVVWRLLGQALEDRVWSS